MAAATTHVREFFTHNPGYKLIALLLALLLWFDVTSDEVTVISYPVPLTLTVEGQDMIVTNDPPSEVDVRFSGSGRELLRLDKERLGIRKVVAGGENDTLLVSLEISDVQRPADLNVSPVGISPARIRVVTDRFVEKTVPLLTVGLPQSEDGSQVVNVDVEPGEVQLRGVTAEVNAIGSLSLDLSQISRETGSFDERLQIAVPDTLRTVTVTPDSVRISGNVVRVEEIVEAEEE